MIAEKHEQNVVEGFCTEGSVAMKQVIDQWFALGYIYTLSGNSSLRFEFSSNRSPHSW
jgi:hypothetical protein